MKAYAGIGSREISDYEVELIHKLANLMCDKGYVLYSGGATGSDCEFEKSCYGYGVSFRPWDNLAVVDPYDIHTIAKHTKESMDSVFDFHPAPNRLSPPAFKLMSRNYLQINGLFPLPKVDFVICCATPTRDGNVKGGTGQAVRIANAQGIPVINLRSRDWEGKFHRIPYVERTSLVDLQCRVDEAREY